MCFEKQSEKSQVGFESHLRKRLRCQNLSKTMGILWIRASYHKCEKGQHTCIYSHAQLKSNLNPGQQPNNSMSGQRSTLFPLRPVRERGTMRHCHPFLHMYMYSYQEQYGAKICFRVSNLSKRRTKTGSPKGIQSIHNVWNFLFLENLCPQILKDCVPFPFGECLTLSTVVFIHKNVYLGSSAW